MGVDILSSGNIEDYDKDTPERKVVEFLSLLMRNNFGGLATCIQKLTKIGETSKKLAGELRKVFEEKRLISYELLEVKDIGAALTEIKTELVYQDDKGNKIVDNRKFRLLYEDEKNNILIRGYQKGKWKILFNFYDIKFL